MKNLSFLVYKNVNLVNRFNNKIILPGALQSAQKISGLALCFTLDILTFKSTNKPSIFNKSQLLEI